MRRRLGYLHVPKTAGTSVSSAIRAVVETPADTDPADTDPVAPFVMDTTLFGGFSDFERMPTGHGVFRGDPADLAAYDAVLGHFAVSTLLAGRRPDDLLALFREPRARLLSLYTYWRSWPETKHASWDPYDASRAAARLDWPDFLSEPAVAAQVDNAATRLLLAPHALIPDDGFIAAEHATQLLDDARAAVDRLGHVDVIERGDACWSDLSAWLGADVRIGRERTTGDERRLDPATHFTARSEELLSARTALDTEVWRQAARRHGLDDTELDRLADRSWSDRRATATLSPDHTSAMAGDETPAPEIATSEMATPEMAGDETAGGDIIGDDVAGGAPGRGDRAGGRVRGRVADAWRRAARRRADR